MTVQSPDAGGPPDEHGGTPAVPEDVWQRFLTDTELAIRATAPREPAAHQRTPGLWPEALGRTRVPSGEGGSVAVGDLWHPDEPWEGPSWRDLDRRAKLRRVGRVAATAAVIALVLGAWSHLATGAGTPVEGGGSDSVLQQRPEAAPAELPTTTSQRPEVASPPPPDAAVQAG